MQNLLAITCGSSFTESQDNPFMKYRHPKNQKTNPTLPIFIYSSPLYFSASHCKGVLVSQIIVVGVIWESKVGGIR